MSLSCVERDVCSHTEYVYPIDEAVVSCPFVSLKGTILQCTFAGPPNYENIEAGDVPETRWILVIAESEIERLRDLGYIPKEDLYTSERRGWVQLISPHSENDPIPFSKQRVIVEGYLGTLAFHVHTPFAIEAKHIYGY
jgi:hypothetical protein